MVNGQYKHIFGNDVNKLPKNVVKSLPKSYNNRVAILKELYIKGLYERS